MGAESLHRLRKWLDTFTEEKKVMLCAMKWLFLPVSPHLAVEGLCDLANKRSFDGGSLGPALCRWQEPMVPSTSWLRLSAFPTSIQTC